MINFVLFASIFEGLSVKLSNESPPSFKRIDEDEEFWDIEGRFEVDTKLSTDFKDKRRDMNEFLACSISVTSAVFQNNWGFGAGMGPGNGGAILVSFCSLAIQYKDKNMDSFFNNSAAVGGALCCLFSNVMIGNARFVENTAYKYGGAVYFQGYEEYKRIAVLSLQCTDSDFIGNTGFDLGGAFLVSNSWNAYFDNNHFAKNLAGITGGAAYFLNSQAKFFDCSFVENEAGNREIRTLRSNDGKLTINQKISVHFRGFGGGAITFISSDVFRGMRQNRFIFTQGCCFLANKAHNGYSFTKDGGTGHTLLFDGVCAWYSFADYVSGDIKYAIGHVAKQWESVLLKARYHETVDACIDFNVDAYPVFNDHPLNTSFVDPKKPAISAKTEYVPTPTLYTYQATEIIRFDPTTASHKIFASTFKFPLLSERTVFRTVKASHDGSPDPTIFFPKRSPKKTKAPTPKRTPIRTPQKSQKETPKITPFKSPFSTPFSSPVNTFMPSATFMPTPDTPIPSQDQRFQYIQTDIIVPTITTTQTISYTQIKTNIEQTITKLYIEAETYSETFTLLSNNETIKTITVIPTYTETISIIKSGVSSTYLNIPIVTSVKNTLVAALELNQSTYTVVQFSTLTTMKTQVLTGIFTETYVSKYKKVSCINPKEADNFGYTLFYSTKTTLLTFTKAGEDNFILQYIPDTKTYVHTYLTHPYKCDPEIIYYTRNGASLTNTIANTYTKIKTETYTYLPYATPNTPVPTPLPAPTSEYLITSTRISRIPSETKTLTESYVPYTTQIKSETITQIIVPSVVFTSTFTKIHMSYTFTFTGVPMFTNIATIIQPTSEFIEYSKTYISQKTFVDIETEVTSAYHGAFGVNTITKTKSNYYTMVETSSTYIWTNLQISMSKLPTKTNIITNCTTPTSTFTEVSYIDSNEKRKNTVVYTFTNVYSYKVTRVMIMDLSTQILTLINTDPYSTISSTITKINTIIETMKMYPEQTLMPTAILPTINSKIYGQSFTNSLVHICSSHFIETFKTAGTTSFSGLTGIWSSTSAWISTFVKESDTYIYTFARVPTMTYVPTETNGIVTLYTKEFTYIDTCIETMTFTKSNCIVKSPIYTKSEANITVFSTCYFMGTKTMVYTQHKFKKYTFVDLLTQIDTFEPTVIVTEAPTIIKKDVSPTLSYTSTVLSTLLFTKTFTNYTTFISSTGYMSIWTEANANTNVCFTTFTNTQVVSSSFKRISVVLSPTMPPPLPTQNLLVSSTYTNSFIGTKSKTYFSTFTQSEVSISSNPTVIWTKTEMYSSVWTKNKQLSTITYTYTLVSPTFTKVLTQYPTNVKSTLIFTQTFTQANSFIATRTKTITDVAMSSWSAVSTETLVPIMVCNTKTNVIVFQITRVILQESKSTLIYFPSNIAISTFVSVPNTFIYSFTVTQTFKPTVLLAKSNLTTFVRVKTSIQTETCAETMTSTNTVTWKIAPAPTRTPFLPSLTPAPSFNIYASPSITAMTSETYTDVFTYIIGSTTSCFRRGKTYVPTIEHVFSSTWTFDNGKTGNRVFRFTEVTVIVEYKTNMVAICSSIPTYTITSTLTYTDVPSSTFTYITTGTDVPTYSLISSITETMTKTSIASLTKTIECHHKNPIKVATISATFTGTYTDIMGTRSYTQTWTQILAMINTNLRSVPTCTVIDITTNIPTTTFTDSYTQVSTLTLIMKNLPTKTVLPTPKPSPERTPTISASRKPGLHFTISQISTSYSTIIQTQTSFMTFTLTQTSTFLNGKETVVVVPTSKLTEGSSEIFIVTFGRSQIGFDSIDLAIAEQNSNSLVVIIAATVSGIILVIIISLLVWFFVGYSRSSSSSDSGVNLDEVSLLHVPSKEAPPMASENPIWATSVMGDTEDPFRNDFEEVTAEGFFNERAETVDSDP